MVGAKDLGTDEGALEARAKAGADQKVINAPADVPCSRAGQRAPPGVMTAALFKFPKGVNETGFDERAEAGPFLDSETVIAHVGLGIGEIDLGMGDVEVAAKDDGLFAFQFFEVTEEIAVPFLAVREALEFALGVRDVNVDEKEIIVLGGDDAAFGIVFGHFDAIGHGEGARAREDDGAGVTFLLRGIPIRGVMRGPELLDIFGRGFGFLETKNIGRLRSQVFQKIFPQHGAEAIHIPRNDFHEAKLGEEFEKCQNRDDARFT